MKKRATRLPGIPTKRSLLNVSAALTMDFYEMIWSINALSTFFTFSQAQPTHRSHCLHFTGGGYHFRFHRSGSPLSLI
jgi:hypothetical protein